MAAWIRGEYLNYNLLAMIGPLFIRWFHVESFSQSYRLIRIWCEWRKFQSPFFEVLGLQIDFLTVASFLVRSCSWLLELIPLLASYLLAVCVWVWVWLGPMGLIDFPSNQFLSDRQPSVFLLHFSNPRRVLLCCTLDAVTLLPISCFEILLGSMAMVSSVSR